MMKNLKLNGKPISGKSNISTILPLISLFSCNSESTTELMDASISDAQVMDMSTNDLAVCQFPGPKTLAARGLGMIYPETKRICGSNTSPPVCDKNSSITFVASNCISVTNFGPFTAVMKSDKSSEPDTYDLILPNSAGTLAFQITGTSTASLTSGDFTYSLSVTTKNTQGVSFDLVIKCNLATSCF